MMVRLTSLTVLEIRIIRFFIEHPKEQFGVRQLSRETKTDFKLTHGTIQKLAQKGIIIKKRQANLDLCSLNLQGELAAVFYVEALRTEEFFRKHPDVRVCLKNCIGKMKQIFGTLIVFGSFAQGKETKTSDIDILIITPTRSTGEEIERLLNSESVFLKHALHTIVVDEKEFIANLMNKEITVVGEAFKNHIILTGVESFYRGVQQTI